MSDEKEKEKERQKKKKNNITHKRQLFFLQMKKHGKHAKEQSLSVFFSVSRCISSSFYLTSEKESKNKLLSQMDPETNAFVIVRSDQKKGTNVTVDITKEYIKKMFIVR